MKARRNVDIKFILKRKGLATNLFDENCPGRPTLESPIEDHARWLWEQIFSKTKLPLHGMAHASATAKNLLTLANLYKPYVHSLVSEHLTPERLKLLQIVMLWHDSAREGDGKDEWDEESALFIYKYLTALKHPKADAFMLAEAMLNKDAQEDEWQPLLGKENQRTIKPNVKQRICQYLIHDADCLDVKRARKAGTFDSGELRINEIVQGENWGEFRESIKRLLIAADRQLVKRGEHPLGKNEKLRQRFECADGYKLMPTLKIEIMPRFLPAAGLTEQNVRSALPEGKVFVRAINFAADPNSKKVTTRDGQTYTVTNAEAELRKAARRQGKPTTSSKDNFMDKHGNPWRSMSTAGFGNDLFGMAGFGKLNPSKKIISSINDRNIRSGFGKKHEFGAKINPLNTPEKENRHYNIVEKRHLEGAESHDEYTVSIDSYDFVWFTVPSSLSNDSRYLFTARYLQNVYQKTFNEEIPIYINFQRDRDFREFNNKYFSPDNARTISNFMLDNFFEKNDVNQYRKLTNDQLAVKILLYKRATEDHTSTEASLEMLKVILPECWQEFRKRVGETRKDKLELERTPATKRKLEEFDPKAAHTFFPSKQAKADDNKGPSSARPGRAKAGQ